jgi:hypothetical protein
MQVSLPFPIYGTVKQAYSLLDNLNQTFMQVSLPFLIYGMVKQTIVYANLTEQLFRIISPFQYMVWLSRHTVY